MSPSSRPWRCSSRTGRRHRFRPSVEVLDERHLPSAGFLSVNLVSDAPGEARGTNANLVSPWGVAFSPTGPFWLADNGGGASNILDGRGRPVPLVVAVPSATGFDAAPTGVVFNGGAGFAIA